MRLSVVHNVMLVLEGFESVESGLSDDGDVHCQWPEAVAENTNTVGKVVDKWP